MWPLYHWPGRAPVGLKDKTIVSLSWSISKQPAPARRLLSLPALSLPRPFSTKALAVRHRPKHAVHLHRAEPADPTPGARGAAEAREAPAAPKGLLVKRRGAPSKRQANLFKNTW